MQTVQEAFQQANKEELVGEYLFNHPMKIDDFDEQMTVGEAKKEAKAVIADYVDRLRKLDAKQSDSGQTWLFYAYHYPKDGITEPDFNLASLDELRQQGIRASNYGIMLTDQAEIMGYYIADNYLTQYYLMDLLVHIMYEASFFGYKQEHLKDELERLERASKETKEGKGQTMTLEEVERELGLEDQDRFTSQENQYLHKMMEYEQKIITSSKSTEIKEILLSQTDA